MAAAGAPAARCLPVLHLLVVILGQPGQALELQGAAGAAVNPFNYEELTSSLVVNQLAILQMLGDCSKASDAPACPLGWVRRESSCYLFDEAAKRTWEASRTYCRSLGGDLVKITSAEENQYIIGQIGDSVWIGLNDRATEGHFVWSDSSQPTYIPWSTSPIRQPDNYAGNEHCGELRKEYNYGWNDLPCHIPIGTVCEKAVGA